MATRGWPVAGDVVYGHADPGIARQALHAWRVSLPHPKSRTPLSIEAPPPNDLLALTGLPGFIES
jgi:23S rRNA pseudouridine1911/1915/1917 synthase